MNTLANNRLTQLVVCVVVLAAAAAAAALEVPRLQGRVNDYAGLLSPATAQQLDAILADLERTDSTQIVVLVVPSLQGDSLERFSMQVAEDWKIGQQGFDNGAVLLIARDDRKIRIEVGYGLESSLTDLTAGRIIRNIIVPRFREGQFDQGVIDGVGAMVGVVRGQYSPPQKPRRTGSGADTFAPLLFSAVFFFSMINVLGRLRRGLGAAAGGVLAPVLAAMFFNPGLWVLLLLVPLGALAGFIFGMLGGPLSFGHAAGTRRRRGGGFHWGGGSGGGFSSGGFGGFSGGGGGFGGGGASGGW
ncbi:MAG TPA: TPM domain-containing protein [Desulfobacterales bacterium]